MRNLVYILGVTLLASGCVKVNDQVITTGDLLNSASTIYSEVEDKASLVIDTATEVKDTAITTYNEASATVKDLQEKADLLQQLVE